MLKIKLIKCIMGKKVRMRKRYKNYGQIIYTNKIVGLYGFYTVYFGSLDADSFILCFPFPITGAIAVQRSSRG